MKKKHTSIVHFNGCKVNNCEKKNHFKTRVKAKKILDHEVIGRILLTMPNLIYHLL